MSAPVDNLGVDVRRRNLLTVVEKIAVALLLGVFLVLAPACTGNPSTTSSGQPSGSTTGSRSGHHPN